MLNVDSRRRIDTARDILVGKVPDPKSQVEQITIALIYKFMDDMDQQSIEMGGRASFFTGEYAKYAWSNIFNPRMGGFEMLALYADAITIMSLNPNLPQLFRDIFKNAFLPYRDPETLKLFLKTINEFSYDHSERLGDAFEYLLSVLGSQGDAGQFRTPRHIIDFMVQVVKPQKNETILDPACGTAGFLISAYKYILECNKKNQPGDLLNPDERKRLMTNFKGYDISPDMGRLSRVNLFLHGFTQPQIFEYDTLTSEERWNEYADVILANPPFMSPKGGIRPHKHFSVQSNRSEVLFVDYMAEHLTPTGRAAIIVPEGIIFQSSGAYKQLRKYLIEKNYLWAVISLPMGIFNPYAGVKTSILLIDKVFAKRTNKILFLKIENDGFDFGAQRRSISKNDLPAAINVLETWQRVVREGSSNTFDSTHHVISNLLVEKIELEKNGEYNLSSDRYRKSHYTTKQKNDRAQLGSIIERSGEKIGDNTALPIMSITMNYGLIDQEDKFKKRIASKDISNYKLVHKNEMVVGFPIDEGVIGFLQKYESAAVSPAYDVWKLKQNNLDINFLEIILRSNQARTFYREKMRGTANRRRTISKDDFLEMLIPLPSPEIQRIIVYEIATYQRIIDGAQQVVKGWKPDFVTELTNMLPEDVAEFEKEKLDSLCQIVRGSSPRPRSNPKFYGGSIPRLMVADVTRDGMYVTPEIDTLTEEGAKQSRPMKKGDLVMAVSGQPGLCGILAVDACIHDGFAGFRELDTQKVITEYAYYYLMSQREENNSRSVGAIFKNLNLDQLRQFEIPLPSLEIQREIVSHIDHERQIVEGNRELIRIYEDKIQKVIDRVWEG